MFWSSWSSPTRRPYVVKSSTAGAFRCPKDDASLRFIVSFGMNSAERAFRLGQARARHGAR